MRRHRAKRLRELPPDVVALIDALPRDVDRRALDRAIADFRIGRLTVAAVVAAMPARRGAA